MTHHRPLVRLVLDTSALLRYPMGSVHVAEPIHEVTAAGHHIGVPIETAGEALARISDGGDWALLHQLISDTDRCAVLGADGEQWRDYTYWRRVTGSGHRAACVLAAFTHKAWILTADWKAYGDGVPIIEIPD